MIETFNVVSEVGEFPQILFSSDNFYDCLRFLAAEDLIGSSDDADLVFIQDQDGNILW